MNTELVRKNNDFLKRFQRAPRMRMPGPDRWKERSRTLMGIADAMAEQWGGIS